jgi:tRNA(Ile)-lysidine synthase
MIKFLGELPRDAVVAFSGGVDSVAVADFLLNGRKRNVELAFFHHGTSASDSALAFCESFARERDVVLHVGRISGSRPSGASQEEWWRDSRYAFLSSLERPVITAHHLDDAVETWIFSSLHGQSKLIPRTRGNVVRPFLVTPKSEMLSWCERRGLRWCEDDSNRDERYMRNLVRHRIVPEALKVNPGLRTVVMKKYLSGDDSR